MSNPANGFSLKPSFYFDKDDFQKEINHIVESYWIFICPSSLISEKKSYFVFKALNRNIVFRRSEDSSLAAFDNICKHRGHQIYSEIMGSSDIRCSYHGWLYGDNLELKKIPWNDKCYHLDETKISLNKVSDIREVNGLIWAYFGSDTKQAKFPAEMITSDLKNFSELYSSSTAFVSSLRNFHWRLIFENLYDRVHPVFLHANSLNKVVDLNFDSYPNDFDLTNIEPFYLANISQSGKKKGQEKDVINDNKLPEGAYINGHIFPFVHFFTPDGGNVFCFESYLPVSSTQTLVQVFWLTSKNLPRSSRVSTLNQYIQGGSIVLNEDFNAVESITGSNILKSDLNLGAHEKSFYALKKLSVD